MHSVIFFGCGGHARSVADVFLTDNREQPIVFLDAHAAAGERVLGFPVLSFLSEEERENARYFFAIGDNGRRERLFQEVGEKGLISILSSRAHLGWGAEIGAGTFVGNFAHIGPEARIGKNGIVNTGAIVEHEVCLGNHVHVGPGARISGRCVIGDRVFVGVGATVKDKMRICDDVLIGAGAVVVHDITDPGVYVGCPARPLRVGSVRG